MAHDLQQVMWLRTKATNSQIGSILKQRDEATRDRADLLEMLETLCNGLEWNIQNHPTVMNESDGEALTAARTLITRVRDTIAQLRKASGMTGPKDELIPVPASKVALEGPYACPHCHRHMMLDPAFLNQVETRIICPYCERQVVAPFDFTPESDG